MNFTYTLRKPSDLKWGNQKPDGSFNGMIGELEKHNADMGRYFIHLQSYFRLIYDYSVRYDFTKYIIIN